MNKNPCLNQIDSSIPIRFRLSRCQDGDSAQTKDQFTGEILHINEHGMVLVVNRPVPAEGLATLTLCGERSMGCEKLLGRIKKMEPCGEESFLVGVEFVSGVRTKKHSSSWHPGTYHLGDKLPGGAKRDPRR